jgi:predicted nuclease of predicted toxin-antitoxin system
MKLLLDANISWRLLSLISEHFPNSVHVEKTALNKPAKDSEIWNFALQYDYIIVTNDEDFYELSVYKGYPPKIIILRKGNMSTPYLSKVLLDHKAEIVRFAESADLGILEIY